MKLIIKISIITLTFFMVILQQGYTQTINWGSLAEEEKHILNVNAGIYHGVIFGAGYGYKLIRKFPVVVNAEYSFPSGKKLIDDFKSNVGLQARVVRVGKVHLSVEARAVFRRSENNFVRLVNWGSDMSGVLGYYRTKWFAAGEVGFDKAIVTNFKHSKAIKDNYTKLRDGWYQTSTGGNLYYGLQAGYSFSKIDLNIKAGKVLTQDFKTSPTVPFYFHLGVNRRF